MRILQVIQRPQLRGAEIFACQLSNHLLELGHEVVILALFEGEEELPFNGQLIELRRPLSKRLYDIKGWNKLRQVIKDFKPDVVQANAADTLKFSVSSKIFFNWNVPIIFRNANLMGDFINSKLKWYLNRFYLSKVSYVISVSEICKKDLQKLFDYPSSKTATIEIGVEKRELKGVPYDLEKIFKNKPVIVHVGSFVAEKNHRGLLRIFRIIQKKIPNAQLVLIGVGKLEQEIKHEVQNSNENNVHFLRNRNDVLDILHNADVLAMPSFIEGLPAVILESMYARTPVVAYNAGGISELLNSKTGDLIEKGQEEKFAAAVIGAVENPNQSKIDRAFQTVSESYLNKHLALKFCNLYKKISRTTKTLKSF